MLERIEQLEKRVAELEARIAQAGRALLFDAETPEKEVEDERA